MCLANVDGASRTNRFERCVVQQVPVIVESIHALTGETVVLQFVKRERPVPQKLSGENQFRVGLVLGVMLWVEYL
jgi:hypothetical protein